MGGHRYTLRRGKLNALYVAAHTVGRGWIEAPRVDHANHILGLRLNDWTSLLVFLAAATVLLWPTHRRGVENADVIDSRRTRQATASSTGGALPGREPLSSQGSPARSARPGASST